MEIILTQDVAKLGEQYDLLKVKDGYGRNFLIPKGYAIVGNDSNKKALAETLKQKSYKANKLKEQAEKIAKQLNEMIVKVGAKVGESGKIFGSVNAIQLSDSLKKLGFEIDRKNIIIVEEPIKTLGSYTANVRLHKEVKTVVNFEVIED